MSGRQYLAVAVAVFTFAALRPEYVHAFGEATLKACPQPSKEAHQRVRNFLAAEHLSTVRQQLGLSHISPDAVRELGLRSGDAEKCGRLLDVLQAGRDGHAPPGQMTLFEAEGFYFATISRPSPQSASGNVIHEASSQIHVFDSGFQLVTRLMA